MKNAAKALDLIAVIWIVLFEIIGAIVVLSIQNLIISGIAAGLEPYLTEEVLQTIGDVNAWVRGVLIGRCVFGLVKSSIALVLGIIGTVRVFKEDKHKTPHIFMIVCGAIAESPLAIVGGILGLIDSRHRNKTNVIIEKPKEEIIVEAE